MPNEVTPTMVCWLGANSGPTLPHLGLVRIVARTPEYPVEVAIREPPSQGASTRPQEHVEDTVRRGVGDGCSHSTQDHLYNVDYDLRRQTNVRSD